jgi:hypothetical protein
MHVLLEPGYEYAEWKVARVGIDYHVEVGAHYYLAPRWPRARRARQSRCSSAASASPALPSAPSKGTTVAADMPPGRHEMAGWNAQALKGKAESVGPRCALPIQRLPGQSQHPQQAP